MRERKDLIISDENEQIEPKKSDQNLEVNDLDLEGSDDDQLRSDAQLNEQKLTEKKSIRERYSPQGPR